MLNSTNNPLISIIACMDDADVHGYRLKQLINSGAYGMVYEAHHPQTA